jgi:RNA polymerase sigma-70 factor (ECF subfamily)
VNGPPRDPAAWLIMVGRNVAIDGVRRAREAAAAAGRGAVSDLEDAEADLMERLDGSDYRRRRAAPPVICCHPDLPEHAADRAGAAES